MTVNPYEVVDIIKDLEKFYDEHSYSGILQFVDSKKLAIYLMQLRIDARLGGDE